METLQTIFWLLVYALAVYGGIDAYRKGHSYLKERKRGKYGTGADAKRR